MAWVTEYDMTWRSGNATGSILLQRDGGTYQQGLSISRDSLELRTVLPSWDDPIMRMNCSFTVVNECSDFYELLPLMTISNGQIRVEVTYFRPYPIGSLTIFIGYLNCESINQDMLNHANLNFTASGLLNKLQYDHPVSIDTLQAITLIDLLRDCLAMTGSSYNIRVHCSLEELNHALGAEQTLFNRTAVFTELFWSNNVERSSGLDIITSILKSFDCYLYWYRDYWYIEHYPDMGAAEFTPFRKTYTEYAYGVDYAYADTAFSDTIVTGLEPKDIHSPLIRPQAGGSQTLSVIPGMKIIEIKLDQKQFFNIIMADLSGMTYGTDAVPLPAWREWVAYDDASVNWSNAGMRFFDITNGIYRTGFSVVAVNGYSNGLSTHFRLTLKDDTMLTLKWKFSGPVASALSGNIEDYTITFPWWLGVIIQGEATMYYVFEDVDGVWTYNIANPETAMQTIEVSGAELDPVLFSVELSVTIPIGEIFASSSGRGEDADIYFGIGTEQFNTGTPQPLAFAAYGDLDASISETADDNLIQGSINTDFLNKKTITLDLFDSGWSYRNVLLTGPSFNLRATEWGYDSVSDSLSRWLLASKFRLFNVARQKIVLDYITTELFQPLQLWSDNKQSDKQFILTSDIYKPESDRHTLEFSEYDNTTDINLI